MRFVWFDLQYEKMRADGLTWALEAYHIAELNRDIAYIPRELSEW